MAVTTIRNFDDSLKRELKIRAAHHDRSMEDEARDLLRCALSQQSTSTVAWGTRISQRFAQFGGVELEVPAREPLREPPDFS